MWSLTAAWGGFGGMVDQGLAAAQALDRSRCTARSSARSRQVAGPARVPAARPAAAERRASTTSSWCCRATRRRSRCSQTAGPVVGAGWQSGKFLYVDTDLKIDLPQARVVIDREQLADLGLDLAGVGQELGTLLGGAYVNRFNYFDRSYKVIPQIGDDDRATARAAARPQDQDADRAARAGVDVHAHRDEHRAAHAEPLPAAQRRAGLRRRRARASPRRRACASWKPPRRRRPARASSLDYAGESRQIRREGSALTVTLGFAVVLIYLVLAAQFHSFRDPLIVLLGSVPLAISGALVFSFLDLTTINIYSQVGLITLVGLIAKNGILIVRVRQHAAGAGASPRLPRCARRRSTRLRPVLMTSAATVFGHFPLVLVTGPGAEARNSIGIVLVTGMTVGTLFTLFVVPVFYSLIAKVHVPSPAREARPTGKAAHRESEEKRRWGT